ncbi:hypothetical protein [Actinokineospora inagensis]|uniref:hypothetical protein n=1 Tax=Actinokineospora inagensis TaxID=103730 RepID=UPI0004212EA9|nr:hypothetical protein [Actinokineospora inagensis]
MTEEFSQDALRALLLDSVRPLPPETSAAMLDVTFTGHEPVEHDLLPDLDHAEPHSHEDLGYDLFDHHHADDHADHHSDDHHVDDHHMADHGDPGSDWYDHTDGQGDDGHPGVHW